MDYKRENKTLTLNELLNKNILADKLNKSAFSNAAKHSTIFSFWENIVGKKLANISKPYKISENKLFITTKNSAVSQQIFFIKKQILEKLNTYSKPLNIEINELVVNFKNYDEITNKEEIPEEEKIIWFDKKDLDSVKLDKNDEINIQNAIEKINFIDKNQKEKLIKKIIYNYKAIKLREKIEKTNDF